MRLAARLFLELVLRRRGGPEVEKGPWQAWQAIFLCEGLALAESLFNITSRLATLELACNVVPTFLLCAGRDSTPSMY